DRPVPPMPEHRIQLRKAWLATVPGREAAGPFRVDLPSSGFVSDAPHRLSRGFQRPPIDPSIESVFLRLGAVAGITSIHLNGREVADLRQGKVIGEIELELTGLLAARNTVEIDVDPSPSMPGVEAWGRIELVIRRV